MKLLRVFNSFNGLLLAAALFTSCAKEDLPPPEMHTVVDTITDLTDYLPIYPERSAILVSINNYSFSGQGGSATAVRGIAKAVFPDVSGNLRLAGNVSVQDISLSTSANNTYSFSPDPSAPEGIDFMNTSSLRWTISGNGDFPPVSFISVEGFPTMTAIIPGSPVVDRSKDFSLATEQNIDNADSVRFSIYSPNGQLFAVAAGRYNNHTFSVSRLSLLSAGSGYLRITAFRSISLEVNGMTLQYLNESVTTKPITIL